eukprot:TRINITY_DN21691_c0_g1_i1.p1 TRINITY_DN21691_c0_g1~~TRINITY_DN21691_c0_g1_i1.p1  ORF type:complete len:372 (-),score=63.00 TRINITY_DN21691_c0_g1_i1:44-1078(-)
MAGTSLDMALDDVIKKGKAVRGGGGSSGGKLANASAGGRRKPRRRGGRGRGGGDLANGSASKVTNGDASAARRPRRVSAVGARAAIAPAVRAAEAAAKATAGGKDATLPQKNGSTPVGKPVVTFASQKEKLCMSLEDVIKSQAPARAGKGRAGRAGAGKGGAGKDGSSANRRKADSVGAPAGGGGMHTDWSSGNIAFNGDRGAKRRANDVWGKVPRAGVAKRQRAFGTGGGGWEQENTVGSGTGSGWNRSWNGRAPEVDSWGFANASREVTTGRGTRIRVANIPRFLDARDIQDAFEEVGPITACVVEGNLAWITYVHEQHAKQAMASFTRGQLNGQTIFVTSA